MYAMYCSALVHRAVALSIVAVVIVRSKFLKNIYLFSYKCLNNSTTLYISDLHIHTMYYEKLVSYVEVFWCTLSERVLAIANMHSENISIVFSPNSTVHAKKWGKNSFGNLESKSLYSPRGRIEANILQDVSDLYIAMMLYRKEGPSYDVYITKLSLW